MSAIKKGRRPVGDEAMSQAERSRKYRAGKLADAREARELRERLERLEGLYRRLSEAMGRNASRAAVNAIIEEMGAEFRLPAIPQPPKAVSHPRVIHEIRAPAQRLVWLLRWRQAALSMN